MLIVGSRVLAAAWTACTMARSVDSPELMRARTLSRPASVSSASSVPSSRSSRRPARVRRLFRADATPTATRSSGSAISPSSAGRYDRQDRLYDQPSRRSDKCPEYTYGSCRVGYDTIVSCQGQQIEYTTTPTTKLVAVVAPAFERRRSDDHQPGPVRPRRSASGSPVSSHLPQRPRRTRCNPPGSGRASCCRPAVPRPAARVRSNSLQGGTMSSHAQVRPAGSLLTIVATPVRRPSGAG
jgi:hypothetical protein